MEKIIVVGASGQLGQEVQRLLKSLNYDYNAFSSNELDITKINQVTAKIATLKPEIIIDCAAYTAVDKAEDEGKELNWRVNVEGTKNLAQVAAEQGIKLVYVSTDYIFDGTNMGEYLEGDLANPKNEYGRAKWAGEEIIRHSGAEYYIVRTSWVFGEFGHNFVFTMQNLAKTHDKLTVVNDQIGRPTWTRTIAEFIVHLIQNKADAGTYQLSNDNVATWFDFAKEILKDTNVEVVPVTSKQYPQKAYRPRHSVMNIDKAKSTGYEILTWQEALSIFKKQMKK